MVTMTDDVKAEVVMMVCTWHQHRFVILSHVIYEALISTHTRTHTLTLTLSLERNALQMELVDAKADSAKQQWAHEMQELCVQHVHDISFSLSLSLSLSNAPI